MPNNDDDMVNLVRLYVLLWQIQSDETAYRDAVSTCCHGLH